MIDCGQALEFISAQLDGELTGAEEALLEEHLRGCAACRALQMDFRRLHTALCDDAAEWNAEVPADLKDNVIRAVRSSGAANSAVRRNRRRWLSSLAAVLAITLIGAGGARLHGGGMFAGRAGSNAASAGVSGNTSAEIAQTECANAGLSLFADTAVPKDAEDDLIRVSQSAAPAPEPYADRKALPVAGAEDALALVYDALGGEARWMADAVSGQTAAVLLLTPVAVEGTSPSALVCVDTAEATGAYAVHCHTFTAGGWSDEYTLYTVETDGAVSSVPGSGDCTFCGGILPDALG